MKNNLYLTTVSEKHLFSERFWKDLLGIAHFYHADLVEKYISSKIARIKTNGIKQKS